LGYSSIIHRHCIERVRCTILQVYEAEILAVNELGGSASLESPAVARDKGYVVRTTILTEAATEKKK